MRAVGQRQGPELEAWLEAEAEYLVQERAERRGLRGFGVAVACAVLTPSHRPVGWLG
jgi:hypothetical protein